MAEYQYQLSLKVMELRDALLEELRKERLAIEAAILDGEVEEAWLNAVEAARCALRELAAYAVEGTTYDEQSMALARQLGLEHVLEKQRRGRVDPRRERAEDREWMKNHFWPMMREFDEDWDNVLMMDTLGTEELVAGKS